MLTRGTDGSEEHWTREIPRLGKRGESLSGSVVARIYERGGDESVKGLTACNGVIRRKKES